MASKQAFDEIAELYAAEFGEAGPPPQHRIRHRNFRPKLNETQELIYDDCAKYTLLHGPRQTGKTFCALSKLVQHARDNKNALCMIILDYRMMGEEGGAWHKLLYEILPIWKAGCGLTWTEPRETKSKHMYIWISNRFGGWSRVLFISMPVGSFVQDRVKGIEPSFIFVDEAQTLESDAYFKYIVQQIGRRRDIALQQIIYCCNPAGPSHWIYKRFFEIPVRYDEAGNKTWNDDYSVYHVPFAENEKNVSVENRKNVIEAARGDDTEYRRNVLGEWLDVPLGEAIFKDHFDAETHMIGSLKDNEGIMPDPRFPVQVGYDLGAAHSSIHFAQFVQTNEKLFWSTFDELNYVDRHTPYTVLVPQLLKRMDYWDALLSTKFEYQNISDNSAFNQFRARDGSFDAQDVERLSGGRIKMLECPKGPGSVETRVRQSIEKLQDVAWYISATCIKTKEMFLKLERDKDNHMMPRKKSRFLHPFDSSTYPHLFYGSTRSNVAPRPYVAKVNTGQVYALGSA